jgi:hypothetical protein
MYRPAKIMLPLVIFILFIGPVAAEEPEVSAPPEVPAPQPVTASQLPNKKTWLLGAALGYTFSGYREETDVPLNRNLNTLSFAVNGNAEEGRFFHSFNIGFFTGTNEAIEAYPLDRTELNSDLYEQYFEYYRMEDTYTRLYLEYALDYKLWGPPKFPGFLGGAFRVDSYIIEKLDNIQYMNLTIIVSLGLHVSQKWIINADNVLVFSAEFPLFGYALRPSYPGSFVWPLETDIVSLHNYWAVFGDLKYIHRITSLLSLYSDIGFELSMVNFPKPRRDAILTLIAGIAFAF